jgi:osmotically-inducible protein OsmY
VKVTGSLRRTDSVIARAIRLALEWDAPVPSNQVHSTVANGLAPLEGDVDYYSERADAERAIAHLPGVRGVTNTAFSEWVCSASTRSVWSALSPRRFALCEN